MSEQSHSVRWISPPAWSPAGDARDEREELARRRLRALGELTAQLRGASSTGDCLGRAAASLAGTDLELGFLLLYVVDEQGEARLAAQVAPRVSPDVGSSPQEGSPGEPGARTPWPIAEALAGRRPLSIDDVQQRFPGWLCEGLPVTRAQLIPLHAGALRPAALAVVGLHPRRPAGADDDAFHRLLAAALNEALAATQAEALERRRVAGQTEVDQAKMAFFSNVSHEFRTPLMLILGPLDDELAEREQPLPPGRHARLETVHRNSVRLLRMVNTLLDFSHIEAGNMQAAFEPVDLAAITESLADSFRAPIEKAGLRLSTRLEALPEAVYVDREMWTKIVLNLLSNALKHTFKGGITLSLFASDESKEHVELRVDDTGVGIPARELPRLFQRFHRVKGARSRSDEGTGVGLALVRALSTLHGGDVSVVSREGLGSSFRVRLRRGTAHLPPDQIVTAAPAAADSRVGSYLEEALRWSKTSDGTGPVPTLDIPAADEAAEPESGARPRVLVADGNADMRGYLTRLLGRSHQVQAAGDGEAALAAALASPPDIIVLDVVLPGRNGFETLRELRAAPATRSIPVILLSAHASEDAALEGLDAGADDYLVKPFSGKSLLARVRSCIALARLRKEAADKLAEANKELEAFSYSVSHDLRTPLRAIDGFSRALQEDYADKLDDEARRYIERIRKATRRMDELIDDLLSLARITRASLNRSKVDLTALSRRILGNLAVRDADRKVEVSVPEGLSGQADPPLAAVLLENLLGNAWKYTSKQPLARIAVGCEERDGESVFFIRDNGAGFSMEYAQKLFRPFQRLHTPAEFPGTGIGLATVHRIVTRHGGRIWADAVPNQGATFFFTLGAES